MTRPVPNSGHVKSPKLSPVSKGVSCFQMGSPGKLRGQKVYYVPKAGPQDHGMCRSIARKTSSGDRRAITSGERYNQRTVPCRSTRIVVGTSASPPSGAAWGWMSPADLGQAAPPDPPARSGAESRPAFSGRRRVLPPRPRARACSASENRRGAVRAEPARSCRWVTTGRGRRQARCSDRRPSRAA